MARLTAVLLACALVAVALIPQVHAQGLCFDDGDYFCGGECPGSFANGFCDGTCFFPLFACCSCDVETCFDLDNCCDDVVEYCYQPTVSSINPSSGLTPGGYTMTVSGSNFGPSPGKITFDRVGMTSTSWSQSLIQFTVPAGIGTGKQLSIVNDLFQYHNLTQDFSYSPPLVATVSPLLGYTDGLEIDGVTTALITVTGSSFGQTGTVTVDGTGATIVYHNHTEIIFERPAGYGLNVPFDVEVGGQTGSATFSYASPSVTEVTYTPSNIVGASLTISGLSFSVAPTNVTARVGPYNCPITSHSHREIVCDVPLGQGVQSVTVEVDGRQSNADVTFTYQGPDASSIAPTIGVTGGGDEVIIQGVRFGREGLVIFAGTTCPLVGKCAINYWNDTFINMTSPPGVGTGNDVTVVSGGISSPSVLEFDYFGPVAVDVNPKRGPTVGGVRITIVGQDFDGSATVLVGSKSCPVVSANVTHVICDTPDGVGANVSVIVQVAAQPSNPLDLFNYRPPSVTTTSLPSDNTTGGSTITIEGNNFGVEGVRQVVSDGLVFPWTVWTDSLIEATVPPGEGKDLPVYVVTAGQSSNETLLFSYNPPVVDVVNNPTPSEGSTAGGYTLSIAGASFGTDEAYVWVDDVPCPVTLQSHDQIQCTVPPGRGRGLTVRLEVDGQPAGANLTFNYSDPVITGSLSPSTGPTVGGPIIRITGTSMDTNGSVTVNVTDAAIGSCTTTACWSHTAVDFVLPEGQGLGQPVRVKTIGDRLSNNVTFDYNAPQVTLVSPNEVLTGGGDRRITVQGSSFGIDGLVEIGTDGSGWLPCANPSWGHVQILCDAPEGQGPPLFVRVITAGQVSPVGSVFLSFDAPFVTDMEPTSGRTAGGYNITLTGTSFGTYDASVFIGTFLCNVTVQTHTKIVCTMGEDGSGQSHSLDLSVGGVSADQPTSYLFSFLPPQVTHLLPAATTFDTRGGANITVVGDNFGQEGSGPTVRVGGKLCHVSYSNHTFIRCELPAGDSTGNAIVVTLAGQGSVGGPTLDYAQPLVTSVVSVTGTYPTAGGVDLVVRGANFGLGATVSVGGKLCINVARNHTYIRCELPAGAGNVSVITTAGDQSSNPLYIQYDPALLSNVNPSNGTTAGGVAVTLTGQNFGGTGLVYFGEYLCPDVSWTDTQVVCSSPEGLGVNLNVTVEVSGFTTPANTSLQWSFNPPAIDTGITNPQPSSGTTGGGNVITVFGSNFGTSEGNVTVGGSGCDVLFHTHTRIECLAPVGSGLNQPVFVNVSGRVASGNGSYDYDPPFQTQSLNPNSGGSGGGTVVTLTGISFDAVPGQVWFGVSPPVNATVVSWDHGKVVIESPAGEGENVPVWLVTVDNRTSNTKPFSYNPPTINSISPQEAPTGGIATNLTVTGLSFGGGAQVTVGGRACQMLVRSPTQLICVIPENQGTNFDVIVQSGGEESNSVVFSYSDPVIDSISPGNGTTQGNNTLTIRGVSLGNHSASVTLGGQDCPIISHNHTVLQCRTPEGIGRERPVRVTLTNNVNQVSNVELFDYNDPSISLVLPAAGAETRGRQILTIIGKELGAPGLGTTSVVFGTGSCSVTEWNHTRVLCEYPAGDGSVFNVRVDVDIVQSNVLSYKYIAPIITELSPNTSFTDGGVSMVISGSNLGPSPSATVGGQICVFLSSDNVNHTSLQCRIPQGTGVDLPVILSAGDQDSNALNFSYAAPVIDGVSPNNGPTEGGTELTLTGTSFGTSGQVFVGGVACPIVPGSYSHSSCKCTVAPGEGAPLFVTILVGGVLSAEDPAHIFNFDPPAISVLDPDTGSTEGNFSMIIIGQDFGLGGYVTVGTGGSARNCTVSGAGWRHDRIECTLPAYYGSQLVRVHSKDQNSAATPKQFTYAAPVVDSISPSVLPTNGSANVTIIGQEFFPLSSIDAKSDLQVDIGGRPCNVSESSFTQIICAAPAWYGTGLVVRVRVDGVASNLDVLASYRAPTIERVSGCNTVGLRATDCAVSGGQTVTIRGYDFGPPEAGVTTAFINDTLCTNATSHASHTEIRCVTPAGTGFAVDVTVVVNTRQVTQPYLAYVGPEIYDGTIRGPQYPDEPFDFVRVNRTSGGDVIDFKGEDLANATVTYGPLDDLGRYSCHILFANTSYIKCNTSAGVGANHTFQVVKVNVNTSIGVQISAPSAGTMSYPVPVIIGSTIRKELDGAHTGPLVGTATEGETVYFDVQHEGADVGKISVFYGPSGADPMPFQCTSVARPRAGTLQCQTAPGEGKNLVFRVLVDNQYSADGTDQYSYPAAPVVYAVSGCNDTGNATESCPTDGGVTLSVTGANFPSENGTVVMKVGTRTCESLVVVDSAHLQCQLPVGTGFNQTIVVSVGTSDGTLFSRGKKLVSYAGAYLQSVSGCPVSAGVETSECPRESAGSVTITLLGTNLGLSGSTILVGGVSATNVVHNPTSPHTNVTFTLPDGQGVQRSILFIQGGGEIALNTGVLSYLQCPPSTREQVNQLSCAACTAGRFSDAAGQFECKLCESGTAAPNASATVCGLCLRGSRSTLVQESTNCTECEMGKFSGLDGSASCSDCPPGSFSNATGSSACELCALGRFSSVAGATECGECGAGTFSLLLGSLVCATCPAGSISGAQASACQSCPEGRYQPTSGASVCLNCTTGSFNAAAGQVGCVLCDAGTFAEDESMTACALCDAGRYSSTGASGCIDCEVGHAVSSSGQPVCLQCPLGRFSNDTGRSACLQCAAGYFANAGGSSFCAACSPGTAAPGPGTVECQACGLGTFQPGFNATTCQSCQAGYVQGSVGADTCAPCLEGSVSPLEGQPSCQDCPSGQFINVTNALACRVCPKGRFSKLALGGALTVCEDCAAGKFASISGLDACVACPVGRYQPSERATACLQCAAGTFGSAVGRSVCANCTAGEFSLAEAVVCLSCSAGRFSADDRATACSDCVAGTVQGSAGQVQCDECGLGTYMASQRQQVCSLCPLGRFANSTGPNTHCYQCPKGTFQSSQAASTCQECPLGRFNSAPGQALCTLCPAGTFGPNSLGATACQSCTVGTASSATGRVGVCPDCGVGTFTGSSGQLSCSECVSGRFANDTGASQCQLCARGSSQAQFGASSCDLCANGTFAAAAGVADCLDCPAGTFGSSAGQSSCSRCAVGSYNDAVGATECQDCVDGTFAQSTGAVVCEPCPRGSKSTLVKDVCAQCEPGQFQALPGRSACDSCPAGRAQSIPGQGSCLQCEVGKFSAGTNFTECEACPVGTFQSFEGRTECLDCQEGKFTNFDGQPACDDCAPGEYNEVAQQSACLLCVPGTFQSSPGQTRCSNCTAGGVSSVAGSVGCDQCPQGRFQPSDGRTACQDCPSGRFAGSAGLTVCQECPAGSIASTGGLAGCTQCAAGRFSNTSDPVPHQVCTPCPEGSFQGASGSTSCAMCPTGTANAATGQVECVSCRPGEYGPVAGLETCASCDPGTFGLDEGALNCPNCSVGTFSSGSGALSCQLCPAGQYQASEGRTRCELCPQGQFSALAGSSTCQACAVGKFGTSTGQGDCQVCPPGEFGNELEATVCKQCGVGRFSPSTARTVCETCAEGSFAERNSSLACALCPAGRFGLGTGLSVCQLCGAGTTQLLAGRTFCDDCPLGTASAQLGQLQCVACSSGTFANETGEVSCQLCPVGTYSQAGAGTSGPTACLDCPIGKFLSAPGQQVCTDCSPGTFTNETAQTVCRDCVPGLFTASSGLTVCSECATGRYAAGSRSVVCAQCAVGKFSNLTAQTACLDCGFGTFQGDSGRSVCQLCVTGKFQDTEQQAECKVCPTGRYNNLVGVSTCIDCAPGFAVANVSQVQCLPCFPGKFVAFSGVAVCQDCPLGKFETRFNSSRCQDCPAGEVQPTLGQTACVPCRVGEFISSEGQITCLPCPIGTFANTTGNPQCDDCPGGSVNLGTNATVCSSCGVGKYSLTTVQCANCSVGRFVDFEGAPSCPLCPAGQFQDTFGQTACKNCTAGSYTDADGQDSCRLCVPGTVNNGTGLQGCDDCPIGRHQDLSGQLGCKLCPVGTFASTEGLVKCTPCPPGRFVNSTGATVCDKCARGQHNPDANQTVCVDCQPGRFSALTGQVACRLCTARTFSDQNGTVACDACPAGRFENTTGQTACTLCPLGRFTTLQGQESCAKCEPSTFRNITGGESCYNCPNGYHSPQLGMTACLECPVGKFSFRTVGGSAVCSLCQIGRYNNLTAQTACRKCQRGRFSLGGAELCDLCPPGTFSFAQPGRCDPCPPGTFAPQNGSLECTDCAKGTFRRDPGGSVCTNCSAGSFNPQERRTECTPCEIGKFSGLGGATVCTGCFPGTFNNRSGVSVCRGCETGRFTTLSQQDRCTLCTPGRFANVTGLEQCYRCEPGGFTQFFGQKTCDPCPRGEYSPFYGLSSCLRCDEGTFGNSTGLQQCEGCPRGSAQPNRGRKNCTACIEGTSASIIGLANCGDCPQGRFGNVTGLVNCTLCPVGRFQELTGGLVCQECQPGFFAAAPGTPLCAACAPGTFSAVNGTVNCGPCGPGTFAQDSAATVCASCPPGFFAQNGSASCQQCPSGLIAQGEGASECEACSVLAIPNAFGTECLCDPGYFADFSRPVTQQCVECPAGADCRSRGTTRDNMGTLESWWRQSNDTLTFYRCAYQSCQGGNGIGSCASNREGPVCGRCKVDYYPDGDGCSECPTTEGSVVWLIFLAVVGLTCYFVMNCFLLYKAKGLLRLEQKYQYQEAAAASRLAGNAEMEGFENNDSVDFFELDEEEVDMQVAAKLDKDGVPQHPDAYTYKLKIVVGFLQILTNLATALEIPWPKGFLDFIEFFNFTNLDFLEAANLECVTPEGTVFYRKFEMVAVVPTFLILVNLLVYYLPKYLRSFSKGSIPGDVDPDSIGYQIAKIQLQYARAWARQRIWQKTVRIVLFTMFLVYPLVSSTVLRLFVCHEVDGETYLRADYHALCYDSTWWKYFPVGVAMIGVYPVGIPLIFLMSMYKNRRSLRRPGNLVSLGFLYDGYDNGLWWYEMVDTTHKLLMTSVLAFLPREFQMPVCMSVAITHLCGLLVVRPYKRISDDLLHVLVQVYIFLVVYVGFLRRTDRYTDEEDGLISFLLIALIIGVLALAFLQGIIYLYRRFQSYREWRKRKSDREWEDEVNKASKWGEEFEEKAASAKVRKGEDGDVFSGRDIEMDTLHRSRRDHMWQSRNAGRRERHNVYMTANPLAGQGHDDGKELRTLPGEKSGEVYTSNPLLDNRKRENVTEEGVEMNVNPLSAGAGTVGSPLALTAADFESSGDDDAFGGGGPGDVEMEAVRPRGMTLPTHINARLQALRDSSSEDQEEEFNYDLEGGVKDVRELERELHGAPASSDEQGPPAMSDPEGQSSSDFQYQDQDGGDRDPSPEPPPSEPSSSGGEYAPDEPSDAQPLPPSPPASDSVYSEVTEYEDVSD